MSLNVGESGERRFARGAAVLRDMLGTAAFMLLVAAFAHAQPGLERRPAPSQLFSEAKVIEGASGPTAFEFELPGYVYRILPNGAGRRLKGEEVRRFNLRLEGLDEIRRVHFMEYRDNVLLVCEVSDGVGGSAFLVRLQQPSMRALWRQQLPAPSVRAVREDTSLYLSGLGSSAARPAAGAYLWQHGGHVAGGKTRIRGSSSSGRS